MWRSNGSPHYLAVQARRLRVPEAHVKECQHIKQVFRIQTVLGQLCEKYHRRARECGRPMFGAQELVPIKAALAQAETELNKLHVSAAAAQAMLDEAWDAFGSDAPDRHFEIISDFDSPNLYTLPLGDGTVGAIDGDADGSLVATTKAQ